MMRLLRPSKHAAAANTHAGTLSTYADDGDCGRLLRLKPQLAVTFHALPSCIVDNHQLPFPQVRVVRDEEVRITLPGQQFALHRMFADALSGMNLVRTTSRRASAIVVNDRWYSSRQKTT
jgi:hypothetical protein